MAKSIHAEPETANRVVPRAFVSMEDEGLFLLNEITHIRKKEVTQYA